MGSGVGRRRPLTRYEAENERVASKTDGTTGPGGVAPGKSSMRTPATPKYSLLPSHAFRSDNPRTSATRLPEILSAGSGAFLSFSPLFTSQLGSQISLGWFPITSQFEVLPCLQLSYSLSHQSYWRKLTVPDGVQKM